MIIDLEKAKKEFLKYTENYDLTNENINRKQGHSIRVMNISKQIATELNLTEEQIQIATLIGLLHDIARFEQYTQYQTYNDNRSFDHGDYGVEILDKDIRKYIETDKYDKIIKVAIKNHNKFEIEEGLNEEELLFSKLIRDADKTDIFTILISGDKKAIWEKADLSDDKISDEIYREFVEDKRINYKERKTSADILVSHFNYVYDLNFPETRKIIRDNKYIDKLYQRFKFNDAETMKRFNEIYRLSKEYIEQ